MMGGFELSPDEKIVVGFAGGGGSCEGIADAIRQMKASGLIPQWYNDGPHAAINHDAEAIAMHAANFPDTRHYQTNIWRVDPSDVVRDLGGAPIGFAWFSPDCKDFSKAKGGKPVEKSIRDLAWVVCLWAKRAKPRIIVVENVEEFQDWGPLLADGKRCPVQKGFTFKAWLKELKRNGYRVEWREERACDFGAPTIRKRLIIIARRDGLPIVWPAATHGKGLLPYRTAAECIQWDIPCPSIFLTKEEGRAIGVKRPLVENTMARIGKGTWRYVINAARPFIVPLTHPHDTRIYSVDEPFRTVTGAHRGEFGVAVPFMSGCGGRAAQSPPKTVDAPMNTITAKADQILVTPFIARHFGQSVGHDISEPNATITGDGGGKSALVAATMVQTGYGEREGQAPRALDIEKPLGTVVGSGKHALVSAHLMTMRNSGKPYTAADEPTHTVTAGGAHLNVVSAFLAQHNTGVVGHSAEEPVSTIASTGSHQNVVATFLSHQYNSSGASHASGMRDPMHTVTGGGLHAAEVRAFLIKYYGTGEGRPLDEPIDTVTSRDRFGLVTVEGELYQIADIGMRMLTPRELFRAQGFPDSYIIDIEYEGKPLTKTAQIRMAGNSVCPPLASAIFRANYLPANVDIPAYAESAE